MKKQSKVKTIIKKNIFGFILGGIIFGTVGVSAATTWLSTNVTYDNSGSGMSALNVQDAIDELYNSIPKIPTAGETLIAKVVTSGDGLYADAYEEGRYVYKGAAPANYITFNGETAGWRIISVEADGTLKIIKNSSLGYMSWDTQNYRDSGSGGAGGTYCANSNISGCNAWAATANLVGQPSVFANMYNSGTVLLDSSLNTYLNTIYLNTIDSTNIVVHNFGVGLMYPYDDIDLATQITYEQSYVWNGMVGLMNVSDYLRANINTSQCGSYSLNNSNYSKCISTNYLYTSLGSYAQWTINSASNSADYVLIISSSGKAGTHQALHQTASATPVLFLKSDITLLGSGTSGDPYTIN